MADPKPKVGQTIQTQDGRQGIVRYSGTISVAPGDWFGLELPDNSGKNDGAVKGERYFQCPPGFGIFVRQESVVKIVKPAAPAQRPNGASPATNGSTVKSRPSGVMPPEVARKRQSLMSAGSGSTVGSRLSVRSPTKSPTKPISSASSAASTPRTGTPATTARTSDSSAKSRLSTSGRTSMAPPQAPAKSASPGPRASIGGRPTSTKPTPSTMSAHLTKPALSTKPTSSPARQSLPGSRLSVGSRAAPTPTKRTTRPVQEERTIKSPTIEEEEEREDDIQSMDSRLQEDREVESEPHSSPDDEPEPLSPTLSRTRTVSISRNTPASVEARTADKRENEQLKAKVRTLERQRSEDHEKLSAINTLQNEKDKYKAIIDTLQKKCRANSQELSELRSKYEEAEKRAGEGQGNSAEHESEIELATLDKEMAEERAEMYHAELEALKIRHEELELEMDIMREENHELGSAMSPEDKANAGWMQMEKEQERLRQALVLLRDMSQQNEIEMKSEIKELQETVDEQGAATLKYNGVAEKLARTEATNKHLMEQLEDAETNDDVVVAMETQREQSLSTIEQLRKQIQDFEEHIQVTDELESFHVDEEKRLHYQLDESEAVLNEKNRQTAQQEKVIEDMEYTLTKFRDVVQGLQTDIDELRRSRDISEGEAHEMSSKSRAMMDLNLQLQNTASKTQLKTIDYEMGKMHAEQAQSHLGIMQLFVPETFDLDRNPVLALLCFKRIRSKAALTRSLLAEKMRDRPHLVQDDPFMVFEVMEKASLIVAFCDRSTRFLSTCSTEEFAKFSGALYELEPVERSLTGWIEALKRDEFGHDGPEYLQRMIGILQDMAEKLITESGESKANEMVSQSNMVECYTESTVHQLGVIVKATQNRLGNPNEEDEESLVFDKRMDQFGTKARTIKYLSGKVTQLLLDLRSGSMCLGETAWTFFEETETAAAKVAAMARELGKAVFSEIGKIEHEEPLSYNSIVNVMTVTGQRILQDQDPRALMPDDVFALLASQLQALQLKVDDLQTKTADINSATEFESRPAPWTVRAKEIKAQKVISQDTQEQLTKLKTKAQEQTLQLAEKDKMIEEQKIRVELLESRSKEWKNKEADVNSLTAAIQKVEAEKREVCANLEKTKADYTELLQKRDSEKAELETLKTAAIAEGGAAVVSRLGDQSETTQMLRAELDMLQSELLSLQASVRYLSRENQTLRIPVDELALHTERNAWLQPANLRSKPSKQRRNRLQGEGEDVLDGLIELAESLKPIRLQKNRSDGAWKKMEHTTRWNVARQREEVEKWGGWRDEVIRRGRVEGRPSRATKIKSQGVRGAEKVSLALPNVDMETGIKKPLSGDGKRVRIVDGDASP